MMIDIKYKTNIQILLSQLQNINRWGEKDSNHNSKRNVKHLGIKKSAIYISKMIYYC